MSEENTWQVSEETAAEVDSTDLTARMDPLFEGSVPAVVKAVRELTHKDEAGVPTGRVTYIISSAIQEPIKEYLPEGEASGVEPRTYNPGHRIDAWIDWKVGPDAKDMKREMEAKARSEFGLATKVVKPGEQVTTAKVREALEKPVILKLSVTQGKQGGFFQNVRFKAPPAAQAGTSNGKA